MQPQLRNPPKRDSPLYFFGGTFDPPHRGHYRIVERILQKMPHAVVLVMPAASAPLRNDNRLFSYRERFHLLRRLFKKEIQEGGVVLSWLEHRLPQPNYTVHTLDTLKKICPQEPTIVIGADQAEKIQHWQRSDFLVQNYTFLIFARGGVGGDQPLQLVPGMRYTIEKDFNEDISATQVRASLSKLSAQERLDAVEKWG